jgi:hypothetical protein
MPSPPKPAEKPAQVKQRRLSTSDNAAAPIVYFDEAPAYACFNNIVAITLTAVRHVPAPDQGLNVDYVVTGYLRCNLQGALALRKAIDDALLLGVPTGDGTH